MRAHVERTSALLRRIAEEGHPADRLTFATLVERLGDRGFGVILFIWALPNLIPLPGISTPFGALIAIAAGQMVLGKRRPWLPKLVLTRSIRRADFKRMVEKAQPYLERFERYCKPRLKVEPYGIAERFVALLIVLLGLVLILPIWGGNLFPATAVAILALGLIEADGLMVIIGIVVGVLSIILIGLILGAASYVIARGLRSLHLW